MCSKTLLYINNPIKYKIGLFNNMLEILLYECGKFYNVVLLYKTYFFCLEFFNSLFIIIHQGHKSRVICIYYEDLLFIILTNKFYIIQENET